MHAEALTNPKKNDTFYLRGKISEGKSFDETRNNGTNTFIQTLLSCKSRVIQSSRQWCRVFLKQKSRPSLSNGTADLSIGRHK
jgi:hypothetical protein